MHDIKLKSDANGRSAFVIGEDDNLIAEMEIGLAEKEITVYHTWVADQLKGTGAVVSAMADHARKLGLSVRPLCPYVLAQFRRHPELYSDLWKE